MHFETKKTWEKFMKEFRDIVFDKTEEESEDILQEWNIQVYWNNGQRW